MTETDGDAVTAGAGAGVAGDRPTSLHAYYGYRDAPAAQDWLHRVLGFDVLYSVPDEQGGVMHSELKRGDAAIMVFSDAGDGWDRPALKGESVGHGTYLSVATDAEVDAAHSAAVEAGARIVWEPAPTEWGSYRTRLLDLEGFEWTVGTLHPGQSTGEWTDDDTWVEG